MALTNVVAIALMFFSPSSLSFKMGDLLSPELAHLDVNDMKYKLEFGMLSHIHLSI